MSNLKKIEGGVTTPQGFTAGATYTAIKKRENKKPDVAVLYSDLPCSCAACFTTNKFCAAPVILDREILKKGKARAVVINSGNANAATGTQGIEDARTVEREAEKLLGLGIRADDVLPSSTGVIGQRLPVDKVLQGIREIIPAKLAKENGSEAAYAIMTTDTVSKEVAVRFPLGGKMCKLGGISKGSGMIAPNMATMLCFLTTDAAISPVALKRALTTVTADTFNMLSIDGDTSTNDMVSILANGMAGNTPIESCMGADYEAFVAALYKVCEKLCAIMAKDGEGATKLLVCEVTGAKSTAAAKLVAKAVIKSTLLKAAIFGADANWGRVLCAIGYAGADVDVSKVDVNFRSNRGLIPVCRGGAGVAFSEETAKEILMDDEITVQVALNSGSATAKAWGCDLTYDYVKINGDYRT